MKISFTTFPTRNGSREELGMAEATEFQGKRNERETWSGLEVVLRPQAGENKEPFQPICRVGLFVSLQWRRFQWDAPEMKGRDALPGMQELSQREELWCRESRSEGTAPTRTPGTFHGA